MTVDFNDYFWGEKNNGFDVLYHNMKYGLQASKELSDFFREKSSIEEQNSKLMSKLAHKASTGTLNSTFSPVWTILRTSAEKLSTLHMQMVQKLSELVKDVTKYTDELHKKHKTVKEDEAQTLECVKAIQTSTADVQKARDMYSSKAQELEKLRKDNSSQKDIDKLETKLRKLQDDYKVLLDKHNPIKNEFERRMTQTCKRFQEIEEMHLRQMKEFLSTYLELLQNNHDMVGQVHSDFKRQFLDMTVDKLLEQFVLNKYTGLEKPEMPELEFIPLSINQQISATSNIRLNQPSVASNSNSATSINRGGNVSMDLRGTEAVSVGSVASGSGSIINADDSALDVNSTKTTASRPTSPEVTSSPNAAAAVTATTSTVKSNFRSWFSSNNPSKQQPQQQNTGISTSATSGSGNFGMDSNCITSSLSVNINATNNTTSTTTTSGTTTTTINKNSLNSELQSLQDNNQALNSQIDRDVLSTNSRDNITATSPNISAPVLSTKKFSDRSGTTTTTTNHHQLFSPQNTTNNNSYSSTPATTLGTSQRRTTSLLNIFSSNSQVSGILRSRRDKTKTKKSKKKKDGEMADNIKEERTQSVDRAGNSSMEYDDQGKTKQQNSSTTNSGLLAITSKLVGAGAESGGMSNIPDVSSTSGLVDNNTSGTGDSNHTNKNNNTASTAGQQFSGNEVDEDGYSLQPPKEVAWDENKENAGSFYSDSDSDSDNDRPEKRIHVKIKPLNNGQAPMSASVDELRATVENISLSPTGVFSQHSQQLQQQSRLTSRQQSPEISNASTPTAAVHPYAPLQSPTLSMSNNSRYADLGDIFSELGDVSSSAPASANLTKTQGRQIPTPTSGTGSSIAIPRPPSRRSEMLVGARGRISPAPINTINRADSIGSLEFRTAIGGISSSRGPSPLTIGISDTIPLAVAFHEIIHAYFRGSDESRCQVKISGDMMLSFPAGIAGLLANNPNPAKLGFRIKNVQNLEHFIPNSKLVQTDKNQSSSFSTMLEFNMPALTALLRRQAEQNPTASYFNVDILKYQVRTKPGASSCPFQLVSYWKCEPTFTALKVDYKYNNHAMSAACPLLNVTLLVPVNGSVRNVQSKPHSAWLGESNRLVWNFTDISQNSQDGGVGTLRARLELSDGPSTPALLTTQFNCEGTTLSGIEFELHGHGYRVSLVKKRFVSGKYVCEGDGVRSAATPTPPSVGSSSPFSGKSN
ncbi:F-BAR domain only protein 2 isoform X1 [Lucilia sericata]|uniref:F-BAR domain only protein 2 isoform X1 n=1 Tax=Lucilia sericata TaxID=13632 RepID=UPI0018A7E8ED|nr:F-BAR domain only protein 2 isoform X1 [Lucilia sericata]XP_037813817.1 F-BAR domain only protein 2 isoform X1 [Lucilia sericata]XP_037813825.1 F-BAR domain only protein 2 isoform X1 [Lucilia sericata]